MTCSFTQVHLMTKLLAIWPIQQVRATKMARIISCLKASKLDMSVKFAPFSIRQYFLLLLKFEILARKLSYKQQTVRIGMLIHPSNFMTKVLALTYCSNSQSNTFLSSRSGLFSQKLCTLILAHVHL